MSSSNSDTPAAAPPRPPVADTRPTTDVLHGDERSDPYAWMRDRDDPAVTQYLEAENAYTSAMTAHTKALEEELYAEIVGRVKETDEQVPARDGDWYYYSRTEKGKAYPIFARKRTLDAPEIIIFDQNEEAAPFGFYALGGMEVSPDGNLLAVLVDTNGYEDFVLRVRDLRTMEWRPDVADKLSWGLAWASDSDTLFYVSGDEAKRPNKVWRRRLTSADPAEMVFHEPNVLFNVNISRTRSGAFVLIQSSSFTQDEWRAIDAARPTSPVVLIAARSPGVEYTVDHGGEWFYILTNRDGATNFKLMRAPVGQPSSWQEFVAYRPEIFVEQIDVFERWLVRSERREGLRRLVVQPITDGEAHEVTFPESAYAVTVEENPEFATDILRFSYESLVTPRQVYDYDMRARTRTLRKQTEVLGGYDASKYAVERHFAPARDGVTRVPVSLVYRVPIVRDGKRPLLLYAYGSYGATMEPTFNSARVSLLDRGFVFAIAHVRGGQEMGRPWYDGGKMRNKVNTFTDFLDVATYLVASGWTSHDRMLAHGGSAGGLLMGAIANMAPHAFRAIVADVPFVDVINTMLDASIPLTAQEWEQWGNPQNAEDYWYMRTYSPYDNVEPREYPRMLVMSGINDSRVAYWEPTKWVAKLRVNKLDQNPLLLHMLMGAGHGGSSGRYDRMRETAFRYAFMIDAVKGVGSRE